MTLKLFIHAVIKFLLGFLLIGLLIFLPAGTLAFFNGWLFMSVLFIPMFILGIFLMFKNPSLLKKRLNAKEKEQKQNVILKLSALMFLACFILAGLTHRFNWYTLPRPIAILFAIVFLIAYLLYAEVLRENTYLSRTIEIQENQKVIDTGLYGIVRHPMYSTTLVLFLSMPLMLGSVYSFIILLAYPFIIAKRIKNEEKLLEQELDGYLEYKEKVKYRVIPFVW